MSRVKLMKNKSAHIHIRCSPEFKQLVKEMAAKHQRTLSGQIIYIMTEAMAEEEFQEKRAEFVGIQNLKHDEIVELAESGE
jgi:uncharacterized protein (DUF1778 family)